MKRQLNRIVFALVALVLSSAIFYSCKKNTSDYVTPGAKFSNTDMTTATFMGQILKEDGSPLDGATVTTGTHMMTSDADGFFYFSNISTPSHATLIKVEKAGYFKAFRTIKVIKNQDNQTKIMVMELPNPESLSASAGGKITISNGGSIDFPANAIVDEVTGQPYTGNVNVYAKWIDPSSDDLSMLVPGDLRAINEDGEERGLTTFGMQAVELVGNAGQKLQLGNGKEATVAFPVPASMQGTAPASMPLWHFDEDQGMWVEEGVALLNGTEYKGAVSHFSFWNADIPTVGPPLGFTATFVDQSNNPLAGYLVLITPTGAIGGSAGSYTNSAGTVSGNVLPASTTFNLYVRDYASCGTTPIYTQTFSSGTTNVNLGTITVNVGPATSATISGTVTDCSNALLANAVVKIKRGFGIYPTTTNASGQFSIVINCVNAATSMDITAYDVVNAVKSTSTQSINAGANNVGNIQACGTQFDFINWDVTNPPATTPTSYSVTEPNASFYQYWSSNRTFISGYESIPPNNTIYSNFSFDGLQSTSGVHNLQSFSDHVDSLSTFTPSVVNLTSYGAVGAKISGSFSTTVTGVVYTNAVLNCNFRVTRQQ